MNKEEKKFESKEDEKDDGDLEVEKKDMGVKARKG